MAESGSKFKIGDSVYEMPDPSTLTFAEVDQLEASFGYDKTFDEIIDLWVRGSVKVTLLFAQIAIQRTGDPIAAAQLAELSIDKFDLVEEEELPPTTTPETPDAEPASPAPAATDSAPEAEPAA